MIEGVKYAVMAIIFNEEGQVLMVSRKDNHSDFGLSGGKVDPEDNSLEEALAREVKEETGLDISNPRIIYVKFRDGYLGYTFLCDHTGEVNYDKEKEPHVVKWGDFREVERGSFGWWNTQVAESLEGMGIEFSRGETPQPPPPPSPRIIRYSGLFEGWAFWKKKN